MEPRSLHSLPGEFERICSRILQAHGFEDDTELSNWRKTNAADFVGKHRTTGQVLVAEMKLYLSSQVRASTIEGAARQLLGKKDEFPEADLLLIVSIPLTQHLKALVHNAGIRDVWDLPILVEKARVDSALWKGLDLLLTRAGVGDVGTLGSSKLLPEEETKTWERAPLHNEGAVICTSLNQISAGRDGWKEFEDKCQEALIFLFGEHFGDWWDAERDGGYTAPSRFRSGATTEK